MVVFNYVEDKDVFQKFYGRLLAKRLVGQLSASDDYEELMISKLKAACGFEYASKLQRMFQDIRLSATLIEEYRTYCENKRVTDIVDFSVMVLTSNSWPFSAPTSFTLPNELRRTFESFKNFYSNKFNGRKLEWLHQHSKGELQMLYTKPKYTLQVSTYQMAVLLLFNEIDCLTVETILDQTQIENDLSRQVILSLLKSKVLICPQITADQLEKDLKDNDIKHDYTIHVDQRFTSKKIKINLNQPIKAVEQKDTETVNQSVEEDRKILIQAAIVRIMKTRKELKHAILIQEVIPQLTSRFKPQIPMIKKCIDILIEKEYLERDSQEKDRFRYLG
jgi:cullin 1